MDSADPEPSGLSSAEAFSVLGHEHRISILHALLTASRDGAQYPTPFAELFDRTDLEVSSQFSYHLDELTDQFVRRTDEGYELRYAGWEIATSILAGTYNERAEFGPTPIGGACPLCGADALVASYEEEWFTIDCGNCNVSHARYPIPPGALRQRSIDDLLALFDHFVRAHMSLARIGVCAGCLGVMDVKTDPDGGAVYKDRVAICVCQRCSNRLYPPLGRFFRDHNAVNRFLTGRDDDPTDLPFWELQFCVSDDGVTVLGTDPWECQLEIASDEETFVLVVANDLSVQSAAVE